MNLPEVVPPKDLTSYLTASEPSFPVILQGFTDLAGNLESLAKRWKLLKGLMHQLKHCQLEFLQREEGLTKILEYTDNNFFTMFTSTDFILLLS